MQCVDQRGGGRSRRPGRRRTGMRPGDQTATNRRRQGRRGERSGGAQQRERERPHALRAKTEPGRRPGDQTVTNRRRQGRGEGRAPALVLGADLAALNPEGPKAAERRRRRTEDVKVGGGKDLAAPNTETRPQIWRRPNRRCPKQTSAAIEQKENAVCTLKLGK